MGWEKRTRGGLYYTRSQRIGARVVRQYCGTGEVGAMAAALDAEERAARQAEREASEVEHRQARVVSDALAGLEALTRQAVADTLHAEGFHRHKGQWRRRRVARDD